MSLSIWSWEVSSRQFVEFNPSENAQYEILSGVLKTAASPFILNCPTTL